jgi:tetratricopeptide (TPR) repeat protein
VAAAQGKKTASTTAQARAHFKTGEALYGLGYYKEAAAEFDEAYKLAALPELLYYAALSYRRLGEFSKAKSMLDQFIDSQPADKSQLKEAKRGRKEIETILAAQASGGEAELLVQEQKEATEEQRNTLQGITARAVPLIVVSEPANARLILNAGTLPDELTPYVAWLPAAKYVIEIAAEGYEPSFHEVRLDPKAPQPLFVKLVRKKTTLTVRVSPRAGRVYIDEKLVGSGELVGPIQVEAGEHKLRVERRFYGAWEESLSLQPDQRISVDTSLGRESFRRALGFGTMGVGTASLGLGVGAGLLALKRAEDLETFLAEERQFNAEAVALVEKGERAEKLQIASLAAGGALFVTGGVIILLNRGSAKSGAEKSAWRVTPGLGSASASVSF